MTSPDGITWTSRSSASDNWWTSVTYGNGLFVAVSNSGSGNRVMTSPDGINWTSQTSATNKDWSSVTYGNGVFVAVAIGGAYDLNNLVMTSTDEITWTSRTSPAINYWWKSVTFGNGVFVAVAGEGNYYGYRVMTSPDGITWTSYMAAGGDWRSITYGNGVFVAVAGRSRLFGGGVMTSSPTLVTPSVTIDANTFNSITTGTSVTFTATPTNGGTTPAYQWKKNGNNVGSNSSTYTDAALLNGDIITCVLTSNDPCASQATATSTGITMSVSNPLPVILTNYTVTLTSKNAVSNVWVTEVEINSKHFEVQKSIDGSNFETIGTVAAKGFASSYSFIDDKPFVGTNYYRLKMVDMDGSFTYSKVMAVTLNDNRKSLVVYPNPVKDNLFVQVTSTKAEKLTLQVTDMQGRLLQQEDTQVGIGNVSISINTNTLAKGSYVLLVKRSTGLQQKQFVKE
jgi:hypothetical protein